MADLALTEPFDSGDALKRFLTEVDVATVEFENVPRTLLEQVASSVRLAPSAEAVAICQHREREKRFLSDTRFPLPALRHRRFGRHSRHGPHRASRLTRHSQNG